VLILLESVRVLGAGRLVKDIFVFTELFIKKMYIFTKMVYIISIPFKRLGEMI
jgi:hypothetical protein